MYHIIFLWFVYLSPFILKSIIDQLLFKLGRYVVNNDNQKIDNIYDKIEKDATC